MEEHPENLTADGNGLYIYSGAYNVVGGAETDITTEASMRWAENTPSSRLRANQHPLPFLTSTLCDHHLIQLSKAPGSPGAFLCLFKRDVLTLD